jgi:hypothetical protein
MIDKADVLATEKKIFVAALIGLAGTIAILIGFGDKIAGLSGDDAWFMWKAWHLRIDGGVNDPLYGGFGLTLFGRLWVTLLGWGYTLAGWHLWVGHTLSTICILLSATIWFHLTRKLGFRVAQSAVLAVLFIVLDPFIRSGLSARPEAVVWLLTSCAVLFISERHYIVAGFIAGLAIESHQMGIVSLAYCAAWQSRVHWENPGAGFKSSYLQPGIRVCMGLFGAAILYFALHFSAIESVGGLSATASHLEQHVNWGNTFFSYIQQGGLRTAWTVLIAALALAAYLSTKAWRNEPLPFFIAAFVSLTFFLEPHAAAVYFIYFFACVPLALVSVFSGTRSLMALLISLTAVSWTGYTTLAFEARGFSETNFEHFLMSKLGEPGTPVIADVAFWPLLHDHVNLQPLNLERTLLAEGKPFDLVLESGGNINYKPSSDSKSPTLGQESRVRTYNLGYSKPFDVVEFPAGSVPLYFTLGRHEQAWIYHLNGAP